ncbi:MAG: type I-E CRISPR-associated protein Cas6/Cse3/CasE [Proteobacteria bacterium]|nr:type I-E CRISPR-associated protein Cas6/Cse3/CasE [Pseudomonadota bacterium]
MNYLTRIYDIAGDDYQVHQKLKNIFDQDDILFQRGKFETVVLSTKAPTIHHSAVITGQISTFLDSIDCGSEFLFTARLNPVVTKRIDEKGKRYPVEQNRLRDWINHKLEDAGMIAEFIYSTEGPRISIKKEYKITLSSVFVTGMCQVKDVSRFKTALTKGIGHSKGLGFGMLNIFTNL